MTQFLKSFQNLQQFTDITIELKTHLPFAQRLLIPALAHGLNHFLPMSAEEIFFCMELIFVSLLFVSMKYLLAVEFNQRAATVLSWAFLLLLPLVTVLNYRYTVNQQATFFYPYDTPALFFTAIGFIVCLKAKWRYFLPLLFIATLNRETTLLLVLLIPALHYKSLRNVLVPLAGAIGIYVAARLITLYLVYDKPGAIYELYSSLMPVTRFAINVEWLLYEQHMLMFMFCFAGLPLLWFTFYDYMPSQYQPIRYIALFYFLILLMVGNVMEPRIFGELIVLMFLPVCKAITNWIDGHPLSMTNTKTVLAFANRYCILAVLALLILAHQPINQAIIALTH